MTSEHKYRNVVSKVRRQLLDAIAFYQRALSQLERSDSPPIHKLTEESQKWRNSFRHHDELGWPGHLADLANEAEHLADRFTRETAALNPGRAEDDLDRSSETPETGRYCA